MPAKHLAEAVTVSVTFSSPREAGSGFAAGAYAELFEKRFGAPAGNLNAAGDDVAHERRLASLHGLLALGIPDRRSEAYRYFSLRELSRSGHYEISPFLPSHPEGGTGEGADVHARRRDGDASHAVQFVDGALRRSQLATGLSSPVTVTADRYRPEGPDAPLGNLSGKDRFLPLLIDTFALERTRIGVAKAPAPARIELSELFRGEKPLFCVNVVRIEVEAGARAEICLRSGPLEEGLVSSVQSVTRVEVVAGAGSSVAFFIDGGEQGLSGMRFLEVQARLEADADLRLVTASDGGQLKFRGVFAVDLLASGARCGLYGAIRARADGLIAHHTEVRHLASDTASDQVYRILGAGSSRSVFNGRIHVEKGSSGIDAHQLVRGLMLSGECEIDAKPDLTIDADDVKCSHGASIGGLDSEQIFYLVSRGISEAQARLLLAGGFAAALAGYVPGGFLRDQLNASLSRLPEQADGTEAVP